MEKRDGGDAMKARSHRATEVSPPPTLSDLGISKTQPSRWQQYAAP
jgi:hypothetical protein